MTDAKSDDTCPEQVPLAGAVSVLDGELRDLSVLTLESAPPQFVLRAVRTMPTPGWELRVDEVDEEVDARGRRVFVFLTEIAPQGIVAQVLTPTEVRIPLGPLSAGRHLVAIYARRGEDEPELVESLVLDAHP